MQWCLVIVFDLFTNCDRITHIRYSYFCGICDCLRLAKELRSQAHAHLWLTNTHKNERTFKMVKDRSKEAQIVGRPQFTN